MSDIDHKEPNPPPRLDRLARKICEAGSFQSCTCPHPIDGWCNGEAARFKAKAAIAFMDNERADEIRRLEMDCQHWANDYAELQKKAEAFRVVALAEIAAREKAEERLRAVTAVGVNRSEPDDRR